MEESNGIYNLLEDFSCIVAGMALFLFFITLSDGFEYAGILFLKFLVYGVGGFTVLLFLGYSIYALMNGGKYCVLFEMNEKGVRHIQMQKQFSKAQVMASFGVLLGAATGSLTLMGSSLLAGAKNNSYSSFSSVKKVSVKRIRHTIYVNEALEHNQIYASKEQFDFVRGYIVSRCKKARIKPAKYAALIEAPVFSDDKVVICPSCGEKLKPEARFCKNCGASVR